ncbi:MAG: methylated-DNA--[protein]-cysteine S-methyltransferase [Rickettsiales bacterium]|jgi:methylated-DNA-[protein]-cysteine S-methyltransferase|nr:methylated-DNA--[protein]-cysteine S-methyltransferase [Rickettsiales bacterium]
MNHIQHINSPFGTITIVANEDALLEIHLDKRNKATDGNKITKQAAAELAEYFAGKRREFSVPIAPSGTDFQMSVWRGLRKIPYGKTISYQRLAANIGRAKACRAVGNANGKNTIPIIIPCHRVIAANGTIGGFSSGLCHKTTLLKIEGLDF